MKLMKQFTERQDRLDGRLKKSQSPLVGPEYATCVCVCVCVCECVCVCVCVCVWCGVVCV